MSDQPSQCTVRRGAPGWRSDADGRLMGASSGGGSARERRRRAVEDEDSGRNLEAQPDPWAAAGARAAARRGVEGACEGAVGSAVDTVLSILLHTSTLYWY